VELKKHLSEMYSLVHFVSSVPIVNSEHVIITLFEQSLYTQINFSQTTSNITNFFLFLELNRQLSEISSFAHFVLNISITESKCIITTLFKQSSHTVQANFIQITSNSINFFLFSKLNSQPFEMFSFAHSVSNASVANVSIFIPILQSVSVPKAKELPPLLKAYFTENNARSHKFRNNIHAYNFALAFTSVNAKINEHITRTRGLYSFCIYSKMYYQIRFLISHLTTNSSLFAQIYFYNTENETQNSITDDQTQPDVEDVLVNDADEITNQRYVTIMQFSEDNMHSSEYQYFADWLLKIGKNHVEQYSKKGNYIKLPNDIYITSQNMHDLIDFVYLNLIINITIPYYLMECAILAPKNTDIELVNTTVIFIFSKNEIEYLSADSIDDAIGTNHEDLYLV
ncbi:3856_t:CDS:2, partial [Cetraspora pellucida]